MAIHRHILRVAETRGFLTDHVTRRKVARPGTRYVNSRGREILESRRWTARPTLCRNDQRTSRR